MCKTRLWLGAVAPGASPHAPTATVGLNCDRWAKHFEPPQTQYACLSDTCSGFFPDFESGPQPARFPRITGMVWAYQVFCIENDEFCIKNDEYCIKNDEFCQHMNSSAGLQTEKLWRCPPLAGAPGAAGSGQELTVPPGRSRHAVLKKITERSRP